MIPARVALALQGDGWWLRSDCIWAKPNPFTESAADRPCRAHEYVFLLSKSRRYFYDAEAVREPDKGLDHPRRALPKPEPSGGRFSPHNGIRSADGRNGDGRNLRTIWTIAVQPFHGAHFATYPTKLVTPCILAGTSEYGVCPECGQPWRRIVERPGGSFHDHSADALQGQSQGGSRRKKQYTENLGKRRTIGWQPPCTHGLDPIPAVVLDPFLGSGTTAQVARALGRDSIGFELNEDYRSLIEDRLKQQVLV